MYELDMEATGKKLRELVESAGYSVRNLRDELETVSLQAIYKWYNGLSLPSVDHLYAISQITGVDIDDILVPYNNEVQRLLRDSKEMTSDAVVRLSHFDWEAKHLVEYANTFSEKAKKVV